MPKVSLPKPMPLKSPVAGKKGMGYPGVTSKGGGK